MSDISNVVDFEQLRNFNEDGNDLDNFLDDLKGNVFKAAYFIRTKDGRYSFGCTEESKVGQERMLYRLKKVIEFYIEAYPDFDEIKETAAIIGKDEKELIEEMFEDGEDGYEE